jgi:hypothetical protein
MTDAERTKLERCQAALGPCVENRHDLLASFLEKQVGVPDAQAVDRDAAGFVPAVSAWLDANPTAPADAGSVLLRVALLIGEVLAQRLGGQWLLDDDPASPHFASYAVGAFTQIPNRGTAVNPFAIAKEFVLARQAGDTSRTLESLIDDVMSALRGA